MVAFTSTTDSIELPSAIDMLTLVASELVIDIKFSRRGPSSALYIVPSASLDTSSKFTPTPTEMTAELSLSQPITPSEFLRKTVSLSITSTSPFSSVILLPSPSWLVPDVGLIAVHASLQIMDSIPL